MKLTAINHTVHAIAEFFLILYLRRTLGLLAFPYHKYKQ